MVHGSGNRVESKFRVWTPEQKTLGIDVHYTMPKVLTVSIAYVGEGEEPGRDLLATVMEEVAEIALKTGNDYAVIDYTLVCGISTFEGNYTIDERKRKTHKL
jgi:hypothetical protein